MSYGESSGPVFKMSDVSCIPMISPEVELEACKEAQSHRKRSQVTLLRGDVLQSED